MLAQFLPFMTRWDASLLSTLDDNVFTEGMAEVIKHAFIRDESLYKTLRQKVTKSSSELEQIVAQNIRIKAEVVAQDEHDNGLRQILNFGHTIGHAIESRSNYTVPHGFAVAKGMERITRTSAIHDELVEMLNAISDFFGDKIHKIIHIVKTKTLAKDEKCQPVDYFDRFSYLASLHEQFLDNARRELVSFDKQNNN